MNFLKYKTGNTKNVFLQVKLKTLLSQFEFGHFLVKKVISQDIYQLATDKYMKSISKQTGKESWKHSNLPELLADTIKKNKSFTKSK